NKTKQNKRSSVEQRDVSEWIVAVGGHKGIIDSNTWIRVQKMLNRNKSKSFRKVKSTTSLLSGLLYCADCDSYMRPKMVSINKNKQNKRYSVEQRDVSEWIVAVGGHKGIIDSNTWIRVQKMLNRNKSKSFRKVKSTTSLLSGLLYCADCDSYMRPKMGRINKN